MMMKGENIKTEIMMNSSQLKMMDDTRLKRQEKDYLFMGKIPWWNFLWILYFTRCVPRSRWSCCMVKFVDWKVCDALDAATETFIEFNIDLSLFRLLWAWIQLVAAIFHQRRCRYFFLRQNLLILPMSWELTLFPIDLSIKFAIRKTNKRQRKKNYILQLAFLLK